MFIYRDPASVLRSHVKSLVLSENAPCLRSLRQLSALNTSVSDKRQRYESIRSDGISYTEMTGFSYSGRGNVDAFALQVLCYVVLATTTCVISRSVLLFNAIAMLCL